MTYLEGHQDLRRGTLHSANDVVRPGQCIDLPSFASSNASVQFPQALAENPDREALEQIARETGDPGLVERLQEEREVTEAKAFMAAQPSYYRNDDNYDMIREYIDERGLAFNRGNLAIAYKALSRVGTLQVDPATPRPLTDHNLGAIALQAGAGDVEGRAGALLTASHARTSFRNVAVFH